MSIIRTTLGQLDDVAHLFDLYRQFYEQEPDFEACRNYIHDRLANDESVIYAAVDEDGSMVGFTQLYDSFCSVDMTRLVYLYDLFVVPEARRGGFARALMDAAREYAVTCGAGRLQLETAITNLPGQALYEDLGWERDKEFYTYHLPLNE